MERRDIASDQRKSQTFGPRVHSSVLAYHDGNLVRVMCASLGSDISASI